MRKLALVPILLSGSTALADQHGFTAAVDVGGGAAYYSSNVTSNPDATELGPLWGLTIGGFARPDLAIAFHSLAQWAPTALDDRLMKTGATVILAGEVQYWPSARWSLNAGLGAAIMAYTRRDRPLDSGNNGLAAITGASVALGYGTRVSLEVVPIVSTSGVDGVVSSLSIGWQYLQ
jgi:hypothetical protein